MKAYVTFDTNQLTKIWTTFDRICKPHPNISRGQIQQEVIHQRNKAVTLFHLFVLFCMLLQTIIKSYPLINGVITVGVCSLIIGLLLLSCHYHPEFFNITYNITLGLSGPILMCTSLQGGHRAWVGAQMYPTLVFFCTGSLYHLIFQASTQIVLLNTIYQPKMLNYLDFTSSTEFLRSLTLNSSTMCFFNMVIIIFINASLNNAYNKVQVAENKKDEFERQKIFLLSFSHELRNIINSLIGNVRLAILENVSVKAKDFLANADLCGESLLHLINNILDSGKVEIGDLEINPVPTEIYDTIQRIWRICSEQIKGKHLYGSLKIQKNIPKTLQIDHYRLMQIFFNLIGNAVKFTERGSINATVEWIENTEKVIDKNFEPYPFDEGNDLSEGVFEKNQKVARFNESYLTLASSASKIDLNAIENRPETTKGLLKVIITDTGSGIAREDAAKLFQKFSQVSSDPGQRKLGTGLGLFITKQLCERMGGEIRVFSKQGKGSSFIFCIPTTPLVSNRLFTFANERQETKNIKALVVDDELLSRTILENYFYKLQIEVVSTARNGLEAFNNYKDCYCKGNYIDLVTMDLTMPVMDGKKAAEKIREFERENGIVPCLMTVISANCSESEIMECTDKNGKVRADFFLKKPARIDEIARAVSNYYKSTTSTSNL